MRKHSLTRCPDASKVLTSVSETDFVVRATAHRIGIVLVLAVVLPEAHRTNHGPTLVKRDEATAGAWIWSLAPR
jgi:hypothetical protein